MFDLSKFGNHLEAHHQIWDQSQTYGDAKRFKIAVTVDEHGKLWQHYFVPEPRNAELLDKKLGKSTHQSIVDAYEKRLSAHMGYPPAIRAAGDQGITLSFLLPEDKVHLNSGVLETIQQTGKSYGLGTMPEASREWLLEKRLVDSKFTSEQLSMAKIDVLRQLPYASLKATLLANEAMLGTANGQKLQQYLEAYPHIVSELEQRFAQAGMNPTFRISGMGATGVFLEIPNEVVMALRGDLFQNPNAYAPKPQVARQPIPQHIQPLADFKVGELHVELLPKLETEGIHYEQARALSNRIAASSHPDSTKQWSFSDTEGRNIGRSKNGVAYVLDGDAIEVIDRKHAASLAYTSEGTMDWLTKNGAWTQYEEFKPLHEQFNSPLHQAGGRLSIEPEIAKATTAGKMEEALQTAIKTPLSWKAVTAVSLGAVTLGAGTLYMLNRRTPKKQPPDKSANYWQQRAVGTGRENAPFR